MKILIISRSFFPQNSPRSFRATQLAKELSRQGHEVVVFTLKEEKVHKEFEKKHNVRISDLGSLPFGEIKVDMKGPLNILKRLMRRILLQFIEFPDIQLMFKVRRKLEKWDGVFDVIISSAVPFPIHWGVAWYNPKAKGKTKIWIAECGDPYMLAPDDSFSKMPYFALLEKDFCRKADWITIPFQKLEESFYPEFRSKMVEIPQGFDFNEVKIDFEEPSNPVPTFAFAGLFMKKARNPQLFFEFLCSVEEDFRFVLYPRNLEMVEPYIQQLGDKLVIKEIVPRDVLLKELSKMDFLVNIGYDPVNRLPSKLIDYSITNRPIYNINTNEPDKELFYQFLKKDYSGKLPVKKEKYQISRIAHMFLNLANQRN